ncbi:MAG: hypothetical protein B6I24_11645 [Bacteroidetes bacterium 4572_128]|nr:MAG: hypothetical protein B6I24_11645 [Bacteroidetes bacterium 4572_128]
MEKSSKSEIFIFLFLNISFNLISFIFITNYNINFLQIYIIFDFFQLKIFFSKNAQNFNNFYFKKKIFFQNCVFFLCFYKKKFFQKTQKFQHFYFEIKKNFSKKMPKNLKILF